MAIPAFDEFGNLPPGVHDASWVELKERYGYNPKRRLILEGLGEVLERLSQRDVTQLWVDGSFVTDKLRPGDVDVVYEVAVGQSSDTWGLLSLARRKQLKNIYHVDLLPFPFPQPDRLRPGKTITIVEYFREDREGHQKGIIRLADWIGS